MYGSGLSKGSQIPSLSLTPIPLPPCCKVRAAVSENGHFLHLSLCSETLPQFHLLDKKSKPKEQLSDEKKQQFPPLFFPPQCHQCLSTVRKPRTSSAWRQLPFQLSLNLSCLQEAVLALSTPDHRRRAPHSPAPCSSGGEPPLLSCCNPAQEGDGISLWVV